MAHALHFLGRRLGATADELKGWSHKLPKLALFSAHGCTWFSATGAAESMPTRPFRIRLAVTT